MRRGFKCLKQHDSMECGVACLAMICQHFGRTYSLKSLSKYCHASNDGVSLLGIRDAAQKLGLEVACGKINLTDIKTHMLPCIIHWNQNHFVVLYKVSKGKYYIADPGKGNISYKEAEFIEHWSSEYHKNEDKLARGIAMFFMPTDDFFNHNEIGNAESHSFKLLLNYVGQYKKYLVHVLCGLFVGCVLQLILPFLTEAIVDFGIKFKDIKLIWLILLGELLIVTGKTSTDFIRRWLLLHISMRVNIALVSDFFIKLLKLPMAFFDTKLMGDLLQRIGDHSRVQNFLTGQLLNIIFTFLSFIIFGIVLFIYEPYIFGVFVIGSGCYGLWITSFLKRRKVLDYELFEQQAKNQTKTFQFLTSMQEIKLQDCERRLAATAVINGQMTLGAMLAVQYIIGQLNAPVEQFMSFIYSFQDVKISLERINEIHEGKNEESKEIQVKEFYDTKSIRLSNVYFKYDPHAFQNTLTDISLEIPNGKITAIVGASGSGKTTLIKLMLGYYPVMAGSIFIADRNINEYNLKWWRRHCGVVMQDGVIFSESIARNIAVDDGELDEERLERSARIANIHDYVMGLPLKYNTIIGQDGVGLSQGQKQRILIARAVYKDPDFIFLDEATNALDAKNERAIVENLNDFYNGRTVIVVAHRLSTVKNADQIIVLEEGKIAEIGNHTSLIEKKGSYYNLVKNQLELGN